MKRIFLTLILALSIANLQCMSNDSDAALKTMVSETQKQAQAYHSVINHQKKLKPVRHWMTEKLSGVYKPDLQIHEITLNKDFGALIYECGKVEIYRKAPYHYLECCYHQKYEKLIIFSYCKEVVFETSLNKLLKPSTPSLPTSHTVSSSDSEMKTSNHHNLISPTTYRGYRQSRYKAALYD